MPAIVSVDGYNVKIHENGKVTIEGENESEENNNTSEGGTTEETPPTPPVSNIAVPGEIVTGEQNKTYTKNGTATIPVGFAIVPGLDDISEGLVISDMANDIEDQGNQFVWIPVTDETPYERNSTYEDSVFSSSAIDDTSYLPDGITDEEEAVRSVKGFYISRYEAGKQGEVTLVNKRGANVWNNIAQETAKETAKTMFTSNTHVKSALISGIQWDMTMLFIASKPRIDGTNRNYDVTVCDDRRQKGESIGIEKTGNNEADKVCNIYDLEGNVFEYVAEKNSHDVSRPFIGRGGSYNGKYSASNRGDGIGGAVSYTSFRLVLYVMI